MRERTGLSRARIVAALALGFALTACAGTYEQFSAEDENTPMAEGGLAKSIMSGLGAIDPDTKPIEYQPRAPLVMPPKKDLKTPENADAALAAKKFPVNPEDRRVVASNAGANGAGVTLDEQEKFANLPKARPPKGSPVYSEDQSKALPPDVMARGHGADLRQAAAKPGGPYKRQTLTDPPDVYGKPNPNAPFEEEKAKDSSWKPNWWPF